MPQKKETRMNEAKERMPKWATWSVEDEVKCNHLENELNEMIQGLHIQVGFENNDGVKYVTYHASWDATKIDLEKWFPNMSKEDLEGYGMENGFMHTYPCTKDLGCQTFPKILGQVLNDLVDYMGMKEVYDTLDEVPMPPQDDEEKEGA